MGCSFAYRVSHFYFNSHYSFYRADSQQKLIVYNLKNAQAIDLINGREYYFIGIQRCARMGLREIFSWNQPEQCIGPLKPGIPIRGLRLIIFLLATNPFASLINKQLCRRKIQAIY